MRMYSTEDTIAAIATAIGEGGIGIVRISGRRALEIVGTLFESARPDRGIQNWCLHYGHIVDPASNLPVDEVLVSYMRAPHSYTREDVVEIHCHGGAVPLRQVLELCLRSGARQAQPGEFTLRAFINGRIDLGQAEAVLDIVRAKTDAGLRAAVGQLAGRLSDEIRAVREIIMEALAYLTATIDFTEQEVPSHDIGPRLRAAEEKLTRLLNEADRGIIYRLGLKAAIVGRPNVGKSSLLNALLRTSRALVTEVPGTTRDTIEETLNLRGIPLVLVDTAGLNEQSENVIERMGMERSRAALDQADLVLWVIDGSQPLTESDLAFADLLQGRSTVVVINKTDLPPGADCRNVLPDSPRARVSALTGAGLADLEETIAEMVLGGCITASEAPLGGNLRHKQAVERALAHLKTAQRAYEEGWPADFITIDLTAAGDILGEITGETVADDLLETIFSKFCIGK